MPVPVNHSTETVPSAPLVGVDVAVPLAFANTPVDGAVIVAATDVIGISAVAGNVYVNVTVFPAPVPFTVTLAAVCVFIVAVGALVNS